ncbi:hypothetical protein ACLM5H_08915 [Fredinandcohnia humi]
MMYLTETNLLAITKKQITFKLKANLFSLLSLLLLQGLAFLFSLNGVGQMGTGGNAISLTVKSFSGNLILFFSIFWAFCAAIIFTTKPYRYIDFSFVSNRVSSHLSTIATLAVYSLFASVTAMFAGVLLRVYMYFKFGSENIIADHFLLSIPELCLGIYIGFLYILLFAMFGYIIGMFVQLNKLFAFVIPALLIGWAYIEGKNVNTFSAISFFLDETSILIFTIKILTIVAALGTLVISATNRMEVRR